MQLNKDNKIKDRQSFLRIQRHGVKFRDKNITVAALPCKDNKFKTGLTIRKTAGKAHTRNLIKRRLREILKKHLPRLAEIELIILASTETKNASFSALLCSVDKALIFLKKNKLVQKKYMFSEKYDLMVGLECHMQLLTNTKLFSSARNRYGDPPNSNIDILDIGLPGTLPVLNLKTVEFAILMGEALGCKINEKSSFDRKHYFYPDLPKGYQITQHYAPICENGSILLSKSKKIGISRIQIEEDTGKSTYGEGDDFCLLDFNRAGAPLLEIVTDPDITSAEEAVEVFKKIKTLAVYLNICDGNMQEGSIRADVNISIKKKESEKAGTRVEVKNLNSLRFLKQAIEYEKNRQAFELEKGNQIAFETRTWDPGLKKTIKMREKENANDYRYMPDPDLLPLVIKKEEIDRIRNRLPELPDSKEERFISKFKINPRHAHLLASEKKISEFFEETIKEQTDPKKAANWIINEILGTNSLAMISPKILSRLIFLVSNNKISNSAARLIFAEIIKGNESDPEAIAISKKWLLVGDDLDLEALIRKTLNENELETKKFLKGKERVVGYLMGQILKKTKNKINPMEIKTKLLKELVSIKNKPES